MNLKIVTARIYYKIIETQMSKNTKNILKALFIIFSVIFLFLCGWYIIKEYHKLYADFYIQKNPLKQDLILYPNKYLEIIEPYFYNEGIINDYIELQVIKIKNNTNFNINNIEGIVEYYYCDGKLKASTPFTQYDKNIITESNKITRIVVNSQTITGTSCREKLTITSINIINSHLIK